MMASEERKNVRLKEYDYRTAGYYFITICTQKKEHAFGEIVNEKMQLSMIGDIAKNTWIDLPNKFYNIRLHRYVIMPNHIHGILEITEWDEKISIMDVVKRYKSVVTYGCGRKIWQKGFYEHVIRNEKDYLRIAKYIDENVLKWSLDEYF